MKPIHNSFGRISHFDKQNCFYNLFLICSSIALIVFSITKILTLIQNHCYYKKYRYQYNTCCGCEDDGYDYNSDNCGNNSCES